MVRDCCDRRTAGVAGTSVAFTARVNADFADPGRFHQFMAEGFEFGEHGGSMFDLE